MQHSDPIQPPTPEAPTASSSNASSKPSRSLEAIDLLGMSLARCSENELLDTLFSNLADGRGGWLVTANLDFLRRFARDTRMRSLYQEADLRVADGMPLLWAAALQRTPLPERIAGSSLLEPLAERAAREGRSLYFLGGNPGTAEACASELQQSHPGLRVAGCESPWLPAEPDDESVAPTLEQLRASKPDIVLVALGSPKQEWLIQRLRRSMPATWFIGVGVSFSFAAGELARAPEWMQRSGLEWVHRLWLEPKRLSRRYLVEGAPFGLELMARALLRRWSPPTIR